MVFERGGHPVEQDAGKVVVIAWPMPCGSCIAPCLSAYTEVQNYTSSYPGRVLYYLVDDYAKLKKEFKLPEYSLLDNEFEISTIETPGFLLRQIRRKIEERISSINHRIENVLHADSNSVSVLI